VPQRNIAENSNKYNFYDMVLREARRLIPLHKFLILTFNLSKEVTKICKLLANLHHFHFAAYYLEVDAWLLNNDV
jgi:hypothetical protein